MKQGEPKPHSFCETPKEKCTMNYCDTNGCQNRKRELVELQEQFKQETLEESKSNYADIHNEVYDIPCANLHINNRELIENAIEFGVKFQQEQDKNKFSEEDLKEAFKSGRMVKNYKAEWEETYSDTMTSSKYEDFNQWFEQFKKK